MRGLVAAALAAIGAVAGCSCSSQCGGPPPDTGVVHDADVPDDAIADAPHDGPYDAPHDAPPDVQPPTGTPVWEDLPFQVVGCAVQRLVNASELKLFNWKACDGLEGCTEAVWHPDIITATSEVGPRTSVMDDGQIVRIGVSFYAPSAEAGVVLTREDGSIQLGLRVSTVGGLCYLGIPSMGGGRFGVLAIDSASDAGPLREGGLLAPLDDLAALAPFEIDPLPPGSGPDETAMGTSRWLWRFAPDQLTTFSNIDGSGFTVFAKISPSIVLLGGPTSTGPSFLFDVLEVSDGGTSADAYIGRSDGLQPLERFISGSPGSWVGAPMFAHSHIGWQKGIGPQGINEFDAVELWASPYSEDSASLAPYKVGDLIPKSWSWIGAGWGRYVTGGKPEVPVTHELLVWNLVQKTSRSIVLPPDRYFTASPGLTRSAFWVVPDFVSSPQRGLMRFEL